MTNIRHLQIPFAELNEKCKYIVMRNYEGFFDDILLEGHNDIDVMVGSKKDAEIMVSVFDAVPRFLPEDGVHYKFLYIDTYVDLDIRTVGDGYYDPKWAKEMIKNRRMDFRGFYIIGGGTDYFYSLVYHAIYQKDYLSDDYIERFKSIEIIDPKDCNEERLKELLHRYMVEHGYYYVAPLDRSCMHRYEGKWVEQRFRYSLRTRYSHYRTANHRMGKTTLKLTARIILGERIYEKLKSMIKP